MATGMIQEGMGRPEGDELNADNVSKSLKVPPELQKAYERVVIAGMKVMFDKESHVMMLKSLKGPGSLGERLGKGITGLMLILFQESNKTMPPQVLIPAATTLLMQAADFIKKAKLEPITNKDIGEGMNIMVTTLLDKFGVTQDKIQQMVNQYDQTNVKAASQQMGA